MHYYYYYNYYNCTYYHYYYYCYHFTDMKTDLPMGTAQTSFVIRQIINIAIRTSYCVFYCHNKQ